MTVYGRITFTEGDKALLLGAQALTLAGMKARRAAATDPAEVAFYDRRIAAVEADTSVETLPVGEPVPFTKENLDKLRGRFATLGITLRDALRRNDTALVAALHDPYHALEARLSQPYGEDTSQDAEPDEDEAED